MKEELLEPFLRRKRIKIVNKYITKNHILCDIGCGFEGTFLKKIKKSIKKGIGFDKKVANLKDEKIELKHIELNKKIPLEDNSVDIVTLLAVIEHLNYPKEIINETFRILNKNGRILITTPDISSKSILEFLSFKLHIVSPREISDHKQYYNTESLKRLLENVGFKEVQIKKMQLGFNLFATGIKW